MNPISVTAHFDGERILLDEPVELEPNTKLIVTILRGDDDEREAWGRLSADGLTAAYTENEDEY